MQNHAGLGANSRSTSATRTPSARCRPGIDFRIDGPSAAWRTRLIDLGGIELPGLTASLALAEHAVTALT
jgi:hypothetical protein